MGAAEDAFAGEIENALKTIYAKGAKDANVTGLSFDYLDKNARKYAKERSAEMIGKNGGEWAVTETTREAANELVAQAVEEGWSYQRLSERLDESGLFSESRADTIARTEIGMAQNYGQTETYGAAGFTRLEVIDGDCDDCRQYDGAICSIAWALENPLEHPNCVRSFAPVDDDEEVGLDLE